MWQYESKCVWNLKKWQPGGGGSDWRELMDCQSVCLLILFARKYVHTTQSLGQGDRGIELDSVERQQ